jgi:hypothetical protein
MLCVVCAQRTDASKLLMCLCFLPSSVIQQCATVFSVGVVSLRCVSVCGQALGTDEARGRGGREREAEGRSVMRVVLVLRTWLYWYVQKL